MNYLVLIRLSVFRLVQNYQRNRTLIDLTHTPDHIQEEIIKQYKDQDKWSQKFSTSYLINNNMKMMIESVEELI